MGKYDFKLDNIDPCSTHGIILSQIKPGSNVLECGCATGYMTKYMHEKMECDVSIVEIDREAMDNAKQYAINYYCGDLNEDGWAKYYEYECSFDYVLFADVLEHLREPLRALRNAAKLIKPNGKIIISIPNICHNDILIRMWYDHFNYSNIGLLDSTHIHFFAGNDLMWFVNQAGLTIDQVNAIAVKTQCTEQKYPDEVDPELLELLKKRQNGEIYQYILTCVRKVEA